MTVCYYTPSKLETGRIGKATAVLWWTQKQLKTTSFLSCSSIVRTIKQNKKRVPIQGFSTSPPHYLHNVHMTTNWDRFSSKIRIYWNPYGNYLREYDVTGHILIQAMCINDAFQCNTWDSISRKRIKTITWVFSFTTASVKCIFNFQMCWNETNQTSKTNWFGLLHEIDLVIMDLKKGIEVVILSEKIRLVSVKKNKHLKFCM